MMMVMLILVSPIILLIATWLVCVVVNLVALAADCGNWPNYENVKEKVIKAEYQEGFKRRHWLGLILGGYV